jgi:hypothetical protein
MTQFLAENFHVKMPNLSPLVYHVSHFLHETLRGGRWAWSLAAANVGAHKEKVYGNI